MFSYDFSEIVSILFPSIGFFSDVAAGAEVTIEAAAATTIGADGIDC